MARASKPPSWSRLPAVIGVAGLALMVASAFLPWTSGMFGTPMPAPLGTIVVVTVTAVATLVVLALWPRWSWPLGAVTVVVAERLLRTIERPWMCAHTVEGEGGCLDEPWAVGAWAFDAGVWVVFGASLLAVIVHMVLRRRSRAGMSAPSQVPPVLQVPPVPPDPPR